MTDDRERLATQLQTNFMVEAAAGTGKTTSMVKRMLAMLAEGICLPDQIAAVTFTRKAAAELRDRFQSEMLETIQRFSNSHDSGDEQRLKRLHQASTSLGQIFIGTIHSFCAQLIRERPIEFGVHPDFTELEADENSRLMDRAWRENLADLIASSDPLLGQLKSYGLDTSQLRDCFYNFAEYRDVHSWPSDPTPDFDVEACQRVTRAYIDDMRLLVPLFPAKRTSDQLMSYYETIVRASSRSFDSQARFFRMLELFDRSDRAVQNQWHDKKVAKREKDRFNAFRAEVVQPALAYWRQRRYQCVVAFVRRALGLYEKLKQFESALDFTDLLLTTARGLREQPHLRRYFQQRFSHLLVDEFQDTDPIQAEAVVLLASEDASESDWQKCRLRPGALFIVGDPKQSIYRFRRGDIVTYNRVKSLFVATGGQLVSLTDNFRSNQELLEWNNELFATKFPAEASDYAPAHSAMECGRVRAVRGDLSGIFRLSVDVKDKMATANEAEQIARFIRYAIASGQTVEHWSTIENRFELRAAQPSDFLIITRVRTRIAAFKAALERHGIDCEVSGCNSFADNPQLLILRDVLQAADDPYNQVHTLSLLRERLFGFSDAELYELKRAGGTFLFTAPLPDTLPNDLKTRFENCFEQLRAFQMWLRALPPVVALEKIASQLGLLAEAAAGDDGNLALGSLLKAFEVLRMQSHQFDSAADLIQGIEQILNVDEADSVSAMGSSHQVVRIMNLHKAKGLEAPIVLLADIGAPPKYPPYVHIDRQHAEPQGAMCIEIAPYPDRPWQTKPLAEPVGWDRLRAEEQRFLDAEEDRLLYVATTRAANMLVVSLGGDRSTWSPLSPYLDAAPELNVPTDDQLEAWPLVHKWQPADTEAPARDFHQAWQSIVEPTYSIVNVKQESLSGSRRPDWTTEGEYGLAWGTAVHQLLDMASKSASKSSSKLATIDLRARALAVAIEAEIPSSRVDELIESVQAVLQSAIWQRSLLASRCYSEMPFAYLSERDGRPAIVRGVIDLIFEEPDGWVIVDYKSDSINIDDVDSLCDYYRPQLIEYARSWQSLTGFNVKEQGLYLTRLNTYCPVA